jgi:hypothetical protein
MNVTGYRTCQIKKLMVISKTELYYIIGNEMENTRFICINCIFDISKSFFNIK